MTDVKKYLNEIADLRILIDATEAGCRGITPPDQVRIPVHVPPRLRERWFAAYSEGYDNFLYEDVDTIDRNS